VAAIAVWLLATMVTLVVLGFCSMFSIYAVYDDEGCMLLTVRQLMAGHPLYDEVASVYGPFPFLLRWAIFAVLRQPVEHDAGRLICLGYWMATAVACAGVVWRLSRSVFAGWLGLLFGFQTLWLIMYEPGHPQELCGFLLALAALVATFARPEKGLHSWLVAAILGALAGCLAMSRINVSVFMLMALGAAVIACTPAFRRWPLRAVGIVYVLCLLTAPSVLMHGKLGDRSVLDFDLSVTLALVGLLIIGFGRPSPALFGVRHYFAFTTGFLVALGAIAGLVMMHGTSAGALVDGVLLHPVRAGTLYSTSRPWFQNAWPAPVIFDLIALAVVLLHRAGLARRTIFTLLLDVGRLGYAVFVLIWVTVVRIEMCPILLPYGLPAAVMLLVPPSTPDAPPEQAFGRQFLAYVTATASLWAFPVAGSQRAFASFLVSIVLIVIAVDGGQNLATSWGWMHRKPGRRIVRLLQISVVLTLLRIYVGETAAFYRVYTERVSLGLPGAHLIRLDRQNSIRYQGLIAALEEMPDTFFTMPGMYSLNLWSHREPPTTLNLTNWMYMLDERHQSRIVEQLAARPKVCVVVNRILIRHWMEGHPLPGSPLIRYIEANYVTSKRRGNYEIRVRKAGAASSPPG
jgi:hypothetical protein